MAIVPCVEERADESFARTLFLRGTDCLGAPEVEQVLKVKLQNVPPIPFTKAELTRARELGQFLILFVPKNSSGESLTMKGLYEQLNNELGDGGKLLYEVSWYGGEVFFTTDPIVTEPTWKLVSREEIPDSASENYLGQTQAIVDYVIGQVYQGEELPTLYQEAITEFEARKADLEKLMESDWKAAAEQLAALKVNQLFRLSPGQTLYTIAVYEGVNHERLLAGMYSWSASRASGGGLVCVGNADRRAASVFGCDPRFSISNLGVVFSRSAVES